MSRTATIAIFAIGALVHQVHFHIGELAFDGLLAGVVKVELDQVVAHTAGHHVAAWVNVDHNAVAGVLKRHGAGNVVELDGLERLVQVRAANVDGGLLVAIGAGLVGRIELAPAAAARFCLRSSSWLRFARRQTAAKPRRSAATAEKRMDISTQKGCLSAPKNSKSSTRRGKKEWDPPLTGPMIFSFAGAHVLTSDLTSRYFAAAATPACSASSAALSVASQVNSGSVRPKWP